MGDAGRGFGTAAQFSALVLSVSRSDGRSGLRSESGFLEAVAMLFFSKPGKVHGFQPQTFFFQGRRSFLPVARTEGPARLCIPHSAREIQKGEIIRVSEMRLMVNWYS